MIEQNRLDIIKRLILEYDFKIPLSRYLKFRFQKNRKMGSRDRKTSASFIYKYFRSGNLFSDFSLEEKITLSVFLFSDTSDPQINYSLNLAGISTNSISLNLSEKIKLIKTKYHDKSLGKLFSFTSPLSGGITHNELEQSYFNRPLTWIRCREKFFQLVKEELTNRSIPFFIPEQSHPTIGLDMYVDLQSLESYKKGGFEVQDLSSQKTSAFFKPTQGDYWWDCCAGSGGKSLLLNEQAGQLRLLVTDIRESVLQNLEERFKKTGIKNYSLASCDLSKENLKIPIDVPFDGIIADVPCSGSGTWSRSPEMLIGFNEQSLTSFSELQFGIIKNILPFLKPGSPLVYITCSVFKAENENVIERLTTELDLKVEVSKLINGCDEKADSMFVSRLIK